MTRRWPQLRGQRSGPALPVEWGLPYTLGMFPVTLDAQRLRSVCERYGVARLEVFGSFIRGTADADSDIDLLYTLAPEVRLGWEIEDLSEELSSILGRVVDLVSTRALNPRIRASVLQEAQQLYAAA